MCVATTTTKKKHHTYNASIQHPSLHHHSPKVMFSRPMPDFSCRLNAWVTALTCQWLMGPCRVVDLELPDGRVKPGMAVHVERCRYLEASACAGVCVNNCKIPTQVPTSCLLLYIFLILLCTSTKTLWALCEQTTPTCWACFIGIFLYNHVKNTFLLSPATTQHRSFSCSTWACHSR